MKTNARAVASALLLGGMLGVPASPVFSSGTPGGTTLSTGMSAPSLDVGSSSVLKGTVQYTNSTGTSDAFSVGTSTSINASVSASSTPDYAVDSIANFGVGGSTINQIIGTSGTNSSNSSSSQSSSSMQTLADSTAKTQSSEDFTASSSGGYWWWNRRNNTRKHVSDTDYAATKTAYEKELSSDLTKTFEDAQGQSGTISGVFKKVEAAAAGDESSNEVTVKGIGANNEIAAAEASITAGGTTSATGFNTAISKMDAADLVLAGITNAGAGTASGSSAGNVSTTASANANSSQYVSSFAQAY